MKSIICPICKNKFYKENKFFGRNSSSHNNCILNKKSKKNNEVRPIRTSTPVAELENNPTLNFSDSVSDFFYQSWKSGLHSNDTKSYRRSFNQWNLPQSHITTQPCCYTPQIILVNTVIYQPYMPVQQVGYRSDGTFGILPMYWPYNSN